MDQRLERLKKSKHHTDTVTRRAASIEAAARETSAENATSPSRARKSTANTASTRVAPDHSLRRPAAINPDLRLADISHVYLKNLAIDRVKHKCPIDLADRKSTRLNSSH